MEEYKCEGTDVAESIRQHRSEIDRIDAELVTLLNERAIHSFAVQRLKPSAGMANFDPAREERILQAVEGHNEGPLFNDNLREIYRTVLKVMKESSDASRVMKPKKGDGAEVEASSARVKSCAITQAQDFASSGLFEPPTSAPSASSEIVLFAGPCAVESEEQFFQVAETLSDLGLSWIRGGAFKPRTTLHSFQGLGEAGLRIMQDACNTYGLKALTEVVDTEHVDMVSSYVDGLQIGTRNMANYSLLRRVGEATADTGKLVMFKRGMSATIEEWLLASEYLTCAGNYNVMLCERGIRTFEPATRFTFDVSAIPVVQKQSFLPVCADVSHPAGRRDLVPALAKAAVAAGCNGLMIEVHPDPKAALSDGPQQLSLAEFRELLDELREIAATCGKKIV